MQPRLHSGRATKVDARNATMVEYGAMTKSEAIMLFSSVATLADALSISKQAVYKWPDELPQEQVDRVVGAAIRTGRLAAEDAPREGPPPKKPRTKATA